MYSVVLFPSYLFWILDIILKFKPTVHGRITGGPILLFLFGLSTSRLS